MPDRIVRVEALRVAATRDYEASAGLRAPVMPATVAAGAQGDGVDPLQANAGRHLCVYPTRAETLLVKITTAEGLVGWGEAHSPPTPRVSQALVEDLLAPQLLGQDPLAIEAHWDRLYHSMRLRGHNSGFMMEALAGIDIALWDLAGKALGQPIYRLLGGPFRHSGDGPPRVPCYASGVPGNTLEERLEAAHRHVANGFSAMKLSIGRANLEQDVQQVETIASALRGRAQLLVDAHGGYDARSVATRCATHAGRGRALAGGPSAARGRAGLCGAMRGHGDAHCQRRNRVYTLAVP